MKEISILYEPEANEDELTFAMMGADDVALDSMDTEHGYITSGELQNSDKKISGFQSGFWKQNSLILSTVNSPIEFPRTCDSWVLSGTY